MGSFVEGYNEQQVIWLDKSPDDFLCWQRRHDETVEIVDIAVNTERRKGKGRRLLELLFRKLRPETRVFAITRIDNEIAQQFYEKCCFEVVGVLRRFYSSAHHCADAIMYGRKAGGPV